MDTTKHIVIAKITKRESSSMMPSCEATQITRIKPVIQFMAAQTVKIKSHLRTMQFNVIIRLVTTHVYHTYTVNF